MYESQAVDLYVIKGVPYPLPSKLLVGLQTINNKNKFSEVISCPILYLSCIPFLAFRRHKIQFATQFYGPRHWGNEGGVRRIGGRNTSDYCYETKWEWCDMLFDRPYTEDVLIFQNAFQLLSPW